MVCAVNLRFVEVPVLPSAAEVESSHPTPRWLVKPSRKQALVDVEWW